MKFSLKHILATITLLFAGVSTSLFGDLSETITQWMTSGENRYQVCQKIGKYGRTLAALPTRKIKDGVLEKCEFELLGINRKSPAQDIDYAEGKREKTIHPHAWKALIKTSVSDAELDTAAQKRREELKQSRKLKKSSQSQSEFSQTFSKKDARSTSQPKPTETMLLSVQTVNRILEKYTTLGKISDLQTFTTNPTCDQMKKMYKKLATRVHPDKGGNEGDFKELSKAYDQFNEIMCQ